LGGSSNQVCSGSSGVQLLSKQQGEATQGSKKKYFEHHVGERRPNHIYVLINPEENQQNGK
jgi:hypothetical protein